MIRLPVFGTTQTCSINPSKIIALGLNYRDHVAESAAVDVRGFTQEIPTEPILFAKTPNVLIGPEEPIIIPRFIKNYQFETVRIDYEAELAFIVKDRCKNVPAAVAFDHIFGFTCMNDVSMRNFQKADRSGWFRAKSLDTFGPIGPLVVTTEALADPQALRITCRLNDRLVQDANTDQMIFTVPEIFAFISRHFTLEAGDIVMTGTPAGVGPLQAGDTVEVEIEKIGVLRNPVIAEP